MRRLAFCLVVTCSVAVIACDPGITVEFENRTDHEIRVSVRGNPDLAPAFDVIAAGATRELFYISRNKEVYRVVIEDENGGLLLNQIFTFDELEARDMRFVVDEEGVREESDAPPD